MRTPRRTTAALGALAAALTLALGGCSDDTEKGSADTSSASPTASADATDGEHNAADVEFASQMIPHHVQALHMVDMAEERENLSPEFEQLLDDIEDTQEREVEQMAGWLKAWGEDVPPTDPDDAFGHMRHRSGPGMMTTEDMDELARTPDAAHEGLWLVMMIEHHEGAIAMAEAEQENGQFGPAVELARQIVITQREEISRMEAMIS